MELLELVKNNLVMLLVLLFFLLMAVRGCHRGLLNMSASFVGLVASVAVAKALMPRLAEKLLENTAWINFVNARILPKLPLVSMEKVMHGISFLLAFVFSLVLSGILVSTLGKLKNNALVDFLDKTLGIILGLVEAMILVWAFMLFVDLMPQLSLCEAASAQIAENSFLSLLHDNNLLITAISLGAELL